MPLLLSTACVTRPAESGADQAVEMLGHTHITPDDELLFLADFFEDLSNKSRGTLSLVDRQRRQKGGLPATRGSMDASQSRQTIGNDGLGINPSSSRYGRAGFEPSAYPSPLETRFPAAWVSPEPGSSEHSLRPV